MKKVCCILIFYLNGHSNPYIFHDFPKYEEFVGAEKEFLDKIEHSGKSILITYQNIKNDKFIISDEQSYNNLIIYAKQYDINKFQFYLSENIEYINHETETVLSQKAFELINKENDDDNFYFSTSSADRIIEEEVNSTGIKSNYKEEYSIKKSEKHVKTLFLWTKIAKSYFEKFDKRLFSEDGKLRYNICTNTSNKNVSLVINNVDNKKKVKSKQILIIKDSFDFSWSKEEGGKKIQNLIIYLIKNFNLVDEFHDLKNF